MTRGHAILVGLLALTGCAKEVALVKGREPVVMGSLTGGSWLVEDVNGGGVIDGARLELTFEDGADNTSRVTGRSGCNRFAGPSVQAGATVRLGPLISTRMMCVPALMDLEAKFLATLAAAVAVRFDPSGAAFLAAPDGRVLKLRRDAP